jgi:hypothetical protein
MAPGTSLNIEPGLPALLINPIAFLPPAGLFFNRVIPSKSSLF